MFREIMRITLPLKDFVVTGSDFKDIEIVKTLMTRHPSFALNAL
jgi:hypothetical protein